MINRCRRLFRGSLTERRARGERGVAMVEMAIVAPLLALILGGIVEYGMLWRDDLTASASTRAAARVASNLGDDHLADYEALLALDAGMSGLNNLNIEGVLIYEASAADGEPHSSCFDAAGDPIPRPGRCNYYSAAQLDAISGISCKPSACAEFPDDATCASGWATNFCPQSRSNSQGAGTTVVGVWIRIQRDFITGLIPGDGVTITDRTVMRVEPR
ncbi:MAG: pilus assembly protein [Acidimicrobiales bacterium]